MVMQRNGQNLKHPKTEEDQFHAQQSATLLPSILTPPSLKEIKMVDFYRVPPLPEANQHG
jgi:hypothetical protein